LAVKYYFNTERHLCYRGLNRYFANIIGNRTVLDTTVGLNAPNAEKLKTKNQATLPHIEIIMNILETIKQESLAARKAKDSLKATLLTTLYSEAANVGKNNGNRETTDAEVVAVVKKFIKGVDETITHLGKSEITDTVAKALMVARDERIILDRFMPAQLTELDLQKIVGTMAQELPERNPKQMGVLMKQLKERYEGQYDGTVASKVIKAILA